MPPLIVPPLRFHDPVALLSVSVLPVFVSVPVRLTVPPVRSSPRIPPRGVERAPEIQRAVSIHAVPRPLNWSRCPLSAQRQEAAARGLQDATSPPLIRLAVAEG